MGSLGRAITRGGGEIGDRGSQATAGMSLIRSPATAPTAALIAALPQALVDFLLLQTILDDVAEIEPW
jgi:hypothetical protein